jgi:serine O-acetyltransferase
VSEKTVFEAYGVTSELPDPVAHAIRALLDHMQAVDDRIETMSQAVRSLDASYSQPHLPELNAEDFEAVEEEHPAAEGVGERSDRPSA